MGNIIVVPEMNAAVDQMKAVWLATKPKAADRKIAWRYFLNCIDDLVNLAEQFIEGGPDKKATVMAILGVLFDFVVMATVPLWLKPFSTQIQQIMMSLIVSEIIDFIVSKYKVGAWNK